MKSAIQKNIKQTIKQFAKKTPMELLKIRDFEETLASFFTENPKQTAEILRLLLQLGFDRLDSLLPDNYQNLYFEEKYSECDPEEWKKLKPYIENRLLDPQIRNSCLNTLVWFVAREKLSRETIVHYFKQLLKQAHDEEDDMRFCGSLAQYSCQLYPKELENELREICALHLVSELDLPLEEIDSTLRDGKAKTLKKLQKDILGHIDWRQTANTKQLEHSLENLEKDIEKIEKKVDILVDLMQKEANPQTPRASRNDFCPCGSLKKYKKCCGSPSVQSKTTTFHIMSFTPNPIQVPNEPPLSSEDVELHMHGYFLSQEGEGEKAYNTAKKLYEKCPDHPKVLNLIATALLQLERYRESFSFIKLCYKKFPKYLFGRSFYAQYLMWRGEFDKAYKVLEGKQFLRDLYPERHSFHFSEGFVFHDLWVKYFTYKNDFKNAFVHLNILKGLQKDHNQTSFLEGKILDKMRSTARDIVLGIKSNKV